MLRICTPGATAPYILHDVLVLHIADIVHAVHCLLYMLYMLSWFSGDWKSLFEWNGDVGWGGVGVVLAECWKLEMLHMFAFYFQTRRQQTRPEAAVGESGDNFGGVSE